MLGEEPGTELERGLVLARVDCIPDRPHPPLRDAAGEPKLAGHVLSQSRVRVFGVRRAAGREDEAEEEREGGAEAAERRVYRVGDVCDGGSRAWGRRGWGWHGPR